MTRLFSLLLLTVCCFACNNDDDVSAVLIEDAVGTYAGFFTDTETNGIVLDYEVLVSRQGDNELFFEPVQGFEFVSFATELETFNNIQLRTPPGDTTDVAVDITVGTPVVLVLTGSGEPGFQFRFEGVLQE